MIEIQLQPTQPTDKLKSDDIFEQEGDPRIMFYLAVLRQIRGIPVSIIGGVGQRFFGSGRKSTLDFDLCVTPTNVPRLLETLAQNSEWRIEHKHPDWLNQVWSERDASKPAHSTDLIHRHSTGLTEIQRWMHEKGVAGSFYDTPVVYAAPEGIALSKVLLWSRRSHDMLDAVQVTYGSQTFRPFDWQLLLTELKSDWRLGYALAVLTDFLYGSDAQDVVPQSIKDQLHTFFTNSPIPGPVRGHMFAYDAGTLPNGQNYGSEATWMQALNAQIETVLPQDQVVQTIQSWPKNPLTMVSAARSVVAFGRAFDWAELVKGLHEQWPLALCLMLYTEVLFGSTGSQAIDPSIKKDMSEAYRANRFSQNMGKVLVPERF